MSLLDEAIQRRQEETRQRLQQGVAPINRMQPPVPVSQLARQQQPILAPQMGQMPQMQMPDLSQPAQPSNVLGSALGSLVGVGLNRLQQVRAPNLKPDGSSPFDSIPSATSGPLKPGSGGGLFSGFKSLFHFRDGGNLSDALKRPGDAATVGEDGPEVAVKQKDGSVQIVPLNSLPRPALPMQQPTASPTLLINQPPVLRRQQAEAAATPVDAAPDPRRIAVLAASAPQQPVDMPPQVPLRLLKGQPAPGEEAANDANFNIALSRYPQLAAPQVGAPSAPADVPSGVTYGTSLDDMQPRAGDARRDRVAMPVEFLEKRALDDLIEPKRRDGNGGWKSAAIGALRGFGEGVARTGSIGGGIGGAAVGAVTHGLNPSLDEQAAQGQQTEEDFRRYGAAREIEGVGIKAQSVRAGIRLQNANATFAEGKPQLEADKLVAKQKKDAQSGILAKLRLLKGQRIDPENPRHMKLLQDAEDAGLGVDPDAWNNATGNWVRMNKLNPADPTQLITIELNKLTGEERVFGGEDGKPIVAGGTEKRDGEGVTVSARAQMNNSSVSLRERLQSGLTGRAKARFDVETRGLFEERRSVEKQINDLHTRASEAKISPAERDRRAAQLQSRMDELDRRIEGSRSRYTGGAPASAPSSTPAGRVSRRNFDKVREDNPSLRGKSDAEVEAELRAHGVDVY